MRIWLIPFPELDDKRVLAQHNEIHMLWTHIVVKGRRWLNWHEPEYRADLYLVHERIVEEMQIRGFDHWTPLGDVVIPTQLVGERYPTTDVSLMNDRWHLLCRWGGIYLGRLPMPPEYHELIDVYRSGGCHHQANKSGYCLICKHAVIRPDGSWVEATAKGEPIELPYSTAALNGDCSVAHPWRLIKDAGEVIYEECRQCQKRRFWVKTWLAKDGAVELDTHWLDGDSWSIH